MVWVVCLCIAGLFIFILRGALSERRKSLAFSDSINDDVAFDLEKFLLVFDENDKESCAIILILATAIRLKFKSKLDKKVLGYSSRHNEYDLIEAQKFLYGGRKLFQYYNTGHVSLAFALWLLTIKSFNSTMLQEKMRRVWTALLDSAEEIPSVIDVIKNHPVIAKMIEGNEAEIRREAYFMPYVN